MIQDKNKIKNLESNNYDSNSIDKNACIEQLDICFNAGVIYTITLVRDLITQEYKVNQIENELDKLELKINQDYHKLYGLSQ